MNTYEIVWEQYKNKITECNDSELVIMPAYCMILYYLRNERISRGLEQFITDCGENALEKLSEKIRDMHTASYYEIKRTLDAIG